MDLKIINKVTIGEDKKSSIKPVLTFTFKSSTEDRRYEQGIVIELLTRIIALTNSAYALPKDDEIANQGQWYDCSIFVSPHDPEVYLINRYLSDKQIDACVAIIKALAPLHGWEVEYEQVCP